MLLSSLKLILRDSCLIFRIRNVIRKIIQVLTALLIALDFVVSPGPHLCRLFTSFGQSQLHVRNFLQLLSLGNFLMTLIDLVGLFLSVKRFLQRQLCFLHEPVRIVLLSARPERILRLSHLLWGSDLC